MKFLALLFLTLTTVVAHSQESFNLSIEKKFNLNYSSLQKSGKLLIRDRIEYELLKTGQVLHMIGEEESYLENGQSEPDLSAYGIMSLYNDNNWSSGKKFYKEVFTKEKYGEERYTASYNHAVNHSPINAYSSDHYIVHQYEGYQNQYLIIRDTKLNMLLPISSEKHFKGNEFKVKDVKEGNDKKLYALLVFKDDQRLVVVRIVPTKGETNFEVSYKRINWKPGHLKLDLHHIKEEAFFIQYLSKKNGVLLANVNKINAKDIDDDSKEFISPGKIMTMMRNNNPKVIRATESGLLIGYYLMSDDPESKRPENVLLFKYNPFTEKLIHKNKIRYGYAQKYMALSYDNYNLNYDKIKSLFKQRHTVRAIDYYDGKTVMVLAPSKDGRLALRIDVFDENLEKIGTSNLVQKYEGEYIQDLLLSGSKVSVNLKHRKVLLTKERTSSKNENNSYHIINF